MSGFHFDADYNEVATLRDGSMVHLQLVQPSDKELFRRGLERLSHESRVRRFFVAKARFTENELRYLTELDQFHHLALCASRVADSGEREGLGVARFIRYQDLPDTAEAAVTVIDEMQGKGLGSLLLQRLIAAAGERGIHRLRCEVLSNNLAMRGMLEEVAPGAVTVAHSGGGVMTIEMELPALAPAHPAHEPPRQSELYKLFTLVAKGMLELPEHLAARFLQRRSAHLTENTPHDPADTPDVPDVAATAKPARRP